MGASCKTQQRIRGSFEKERPAALSGRLALTNARGTRSYGHGGTGPRSTCSGKNGKQLLASRFRIRTAHRAPAPILQGCEATTQGENERVLAGHGSGDTGLPAFLSEIHDCNANRNGSEAKKEQRKGGEQFAHRIDLQRCEHDQEQPHPFTARIFLLHASRLPSPKNRNDCTKVDGVSGRPLTGGPNFSTCPIRQEALRKTYGTGASKCDSNQ